MTWWVGAIFAVLAVGVSATPTIGRVSAWAAGQSVQLAPTWLGAVVAAVCLAIPAARAGWTAALPAYAVFGAGLVPLVLVDVRLHRLPDRLTLPMVPAGLLLLAIAAAVGDQWSPWLRALVGCGGLFLGYLVLHVLARGALGAGDVKLGAVLGPHLAWFGWPTLVVGTFAAFLVGGVVAITLLVARKATRQSRLPFGPAMVAGALVALAIGDDVSCNLLGW